MLPALKIFILAAALVNIDAFSREARTGALHIPEKIIGGVIEIVQSHKNKPVPATLNYQNVQQNQQYPQHQQWNGQTNQNQIQHTQFQEQGQAQYASGFQHGYNQGSYNQVIAQNHPTPAQGFNQGHNLGQNQGSVNTQNQANNQYQQVGYQGENWNQNNNQYHQTNQIGSQYQGNQVQGLYVPANQGSQYQGSSQYQGQSGQTNQNLYGSNQYQNGQFGQNQYQNGQFNQNQYQNGQFSQNQNQNGHYQTSSNQYQGSQTGHGGNGQGSLIAGQQTSGNSQGPACVCQAWTKPHDVMSDTPATEKKEKTQE